MLSRTRRKVREMSFRDSVVVVTGVGRQGQVGESLAAAFAEAGARVAAVGHSAVDVQARVKDLQVAGREARAFACDLADETQLAALVSDVQTAFGGAVHALVHAAGGFAVSGPVATSATSVWHTQIRINVTTAYLVTRAFLPLVRAGKGTILYFSSSAALPGAKVAGVSAYAVAKTGVATLTRAVAEEERSNGIRVNALAPVAIRTAANESAMGDKAPYVERDEVVRTVLYLCSADASAVTGQLIALS